MLLGLLASVSVKEGDVVARVLGRWMSEDEGIKDLAGRVFPLDISEDSEELFRMRCKQPAPFRGAGDITEWKWLFAAAPKRAAIWFGILVRDLDPQALIRSESPSVLLHGFEAAIQSLPMDAGEIVWSELIQLWRLSLIHI